MRQVPHYLIIGRGRVARHIQHYFSLLQLSFESWHREKTIVELHTKLNRATHVLLLISDQAIDDFFVTHLNNREIFSIHFSGSVVSSYSDGAHPLMTFSEHLYPVSVYQSIPFILDHDAPSFETLLPGIPNQHVRLNTALKAKYHALCVLSGNFSCLLWQKLFCDFSNELHIPSSIAYPYLKQQMQNLLSHSTSVLTGPLVRGDQETIESNLNALNGDPFQVVYEGFVACYKQLKGDQT